MVTQPVLMLLFVSVDVASDEYVFCFKRDVLLHSTSLQGLISHMLLVDPGLLALFEDLSLTKSGIIA